MGGAWAADLSSGVSSDELLSENFLDYKNRGINGSHRGQIIWKIDSSSHFSEGASPAASFLAS